MQKETRKKNRTLYEERKDIEKMKMLFALVRGSKISDKQLSRTLGMSQTTATRRRKELEKEGYINEYTMIPNFSKIGIEIVAFIFGFADATELTPEKVSEAREWLSEQPEVLCNLEGQGLDSNFIQISVHKNYEGYLEFLRRIRGQPSRGGHITGIFAVSTSKTDLVLKPFSLRQIESLLLPPETKPSSPRT